MADVAAASSEPAGPKPRRRFSGSNIMVYGFLLLMCLLGCSRTAISFTTPYITARIKTIMRQMKHRHEEDEAFFASYLSLKRSVANIVSAVVLGFCAAAVPLAEKVAGHPMGSAPVPTSRFLLICCTVTACLGAVFTSLTLRGIDRELKSDSAA